MSRIAAASISIKLVKLATYLLSVAGSVEVTDQLCMWGVKHGKTRNRSSGLVSHVSSARVQVQMRCIILPAGVSCCPESGIKYPGKLFWLLASKYSGKLLSYTRVRCI